MEFQLLRTCSVESDRESIMKKTIRVKFVGFWDGCVPEKTRIYLDLSKLYNVEISDRPDYIICSCFEPLYDYCNFPQVRIMDVGENYIPDFNLVDYAISRYPISLLDRSFFHPGCIDFRGHFEALLRPREKRDESFVAGKKYFANFISGHESENNIRGDFFKLLSQYKRVESPGTYLNNMGEGTTVNWKDSSKTDFQRQCKFTLCFESTKSGGFITEKITDAFFADTIPVYFGSEQVFEIFNKDAFIYCGSRDDFDETIEKIKALDSDDSQYLQMINQPVLNPDFDYQGFRSDYETFLKHIFDQPVEQAYRRSRVYVPKQHENYLKQTQEPKKGKRRGFFRRLKNE